MSLKAKDPELFDALINLTNTAWDMPSKPDEMYIDTYDSNDNPTKIDYYKDGVLLFSHLLEYDGKLLKRKKFIS